MKRSFRVWVSLPLWLGALLIPVAAFPETPARTEVFLQTAHDSAVLDLAYTADGKALISASRSSVKLWDAATWRLLRTLDTGADILNTAGTDARVIAFSPDGRWLAKVSQNGVIRLWDIARGRPTHVLSGHRDRITTVDFSADGSRIASVAMDGFLRVWDTATGRLLATVALPGGGASAQLVFMPDVRQVIVASGWPKDVSLRTVDIASAKIVHGFSLGTNNGPSRLVISPDGQRAAIAYTNIKQAELWELAGGRKLAMVGQNTISLRALRFSADGGQLVLAGSGGSFDPETMKDAQYGLIEIWDGRGSEAARQRPSRRPMGQGRRRWRAFYR